jgi:hypothetical protein
MTPEEQVTALIETFARFRHEDTGPDHRPTGRGFGTVQRFGASPVGYATWDEAPESWREQYRAAVRRDAGIEEEPTTPPDPQLARNARELIARHGWIQEG